MDIFSEIIKLLPLSMLKQALFINKTWSLLTVNQVENIINGKINPFQYFKLFQHSINKPIPINTPGIFFPNRLRLPLAAFNLEDGCLTINNKHEPRINNKEFIDFCHFRQANHLSDVFYFKSLNYDRYDCIVWAYIGKLDKYFIYFKAKCSDNDYKPKGRGSFAYSEDWTTLWNTYVSDVDQKQLLKYNGLDKFRIKL